jgi:hypothetical protein
MPSDTAAALHAPQRQMQAGAAACGGIDLGNLGSHLLHGALETVVRGVAILLRHVAPRKAGRRLRSRLVEALVVARRWQAGSLISSSH